MPTFFANCPGRVVQVRQPTSYCDIRMIAINNQNLTDLSYERSAVILTRITVSHQVNAQFLHTVGNRVYIYSFGDRIGQITLSGLAFAQTCERGPSVHSGTNVFSWYIANKASTKVTPLFVTIYNATFQAFLLGLNMEVVDPATKLVQWNLTLATMPG